MSLIRIISIFFFIVAIALGAYLTLSIKSKIDEDKYVKDEEARVINKLKMIRDAELSYLAVNGTYTGGWDTLVNFLDTGTMYIIQRTEKVYTLNYGTDSVVVHVDTIGQIPVKDSIFVIKEPVPSLVKGTVESINISKDQSVKKGDVLFTVRNPKGKKLKMRAQHDGFIKSISKQEGDPVENDEEVMVLNYPRIDDVHNLPYLPDGKEQDKKFDLFAGKIVRGNVVVSVFEAKDTDPINPRRRKKGQENPLRVGSRIDVSTTGNWE